MEIKSYGSKVDYNRLDHGENQRSWDTKQQNDEVQNIRNNVKDTMSSVQSIMSKGVIVNGEHNRVDENEEAEHDGKGRE